MNLTVQIPDDVAERLRAAGGDLSRRALEAVDCEFHRRVRPLSETNPELFARLDAVRQQLGPKRT